MRPQFVRQGGRDYVRVRLIVNLSSLTGSPDGSGVIWDVQDGILYAA
jgi:hypothetical protein